MSKLGHKVYSLIWEVVVKLVQAGFRDTIAGLSDKTDWAANEDAVVTKFAVPDTQMTLFLVYTARMNELNRGNKRVVTVTSLISLASSADLHSRIL